MCCGWSASGEEPDESALFEIGSITKAFTGVLLAEMVLRGEVADGRTFASWPPRPPIQDFMPAAGSLRSSADDMVRLLAACLEPPDDALGAALRLAQQPQARIGKGLQVGLCWFIVTRRDRPRVVWHNGGTWGFRSFAGFAPDQGTGAVVMSNTSRSVDRLGLRLLQSTATPVG